MLRSLVIEGELRRKSIASESAIDEQAEAAAAEAEELRAQLSAVMTGRESAERQLAALEARVAAADELLEALRRRREAAAARVTKVNAPLLRIEQAASLEEEKLLAAREKSVSSSAAALDKIPERSTKLKTLVSELEQKREILAPQAKASNPGAIGLSKGVDGWWKGYQLNQEFKQVVSKKATALAALAKLEDELLTLQLRQETANSAFADAAAEAKRKSDVKRKQFYAQYGETLLEAETEAALVEAIAVEIGIPSVEAEVEAEAQQEEEDKEVKTEEEAAEAPEMAEEAEVEVEA